MDLFWWITASGLAMSAIALVGAVTLFFAANTIQRILLPLVALAAGALLGGAFLELIPGAIQQVGDQPTVFLAVLAGFSLFFGLEQVISLHHGHSVDPAMDPAGDHDAKPDHQPLTYLILLASGLHHFIGGLAVGGAFVANIGLGISAWLAAAVHEVPQELGDFAVLVHGGWKVPQALLFNFLSAATFLIGGWLAYALATSWDVSLLLPFAAGNFIYIGASDLIPEVKHHRSAVHNVIHFLSFLTGIAVFVVLVFLEKQS